MTNIISLSHTGNSEHENLACKFLACLVRQTGHSVHLQGFVTNCIKSAMCANCVGSHCRAADRKLNGLEHHYTDSNVHSDKSKFWKFLCNTESLTQGIFLYYIPNFSEKSHQHHYKK